MAKEARELNKSEKAAVFFLCMDEDATSQLFSQMEDEEIKKIGSALLNLKKVPANAIEQMIDEFLTKVQDVPATAIVEKNLKFEDMAFDGKKVAKNLILRGLKGNRGQDILANLGKTMPASTEDLNDFGKLLTNYSSDDLYKLFKEEHPQVLAIVALYAKKKIAKDFVSKYSKEIQIEMISRMAQVKIIPKAVIDELNKIIIQDIENKRKAKSSTTTQVEEEEVEEDIEIPGMDNTLGILKILTNDVSSSLLEGVDQIDHELAEQLAKNMFTLEDLLRADDVGMRELLRGITNDDLKFSLKDASEEIQEKFLANMSSRAAKIIREDMQVMPSLKVDDIEAARSNILKVAKNLIKEEKLHLSSLEDENEDE